MNETDELKRPKSEDEERPSSRSRTSQSDRLFYWQQNLPTSHQQTVMKRFSTYRSIFLAVASVALLFVSVEASGATRRAAVAEAARVGREFTIKVGRTVTLKGETLRLRFVKVAADSRCPTGVDCVWAGNAEVLVEVSAGGARSRRTLSLNTTAGQGRAGEATYRRYTVKLVGLSPYPSNTRKIRQGQYVATLLVTEE